jgi:hypothetical protein
MHAISSSRHSSKGKAGASLSSNSVWALLLLITALLVFCWQALQIGRWQQTPVKGDSSSLQDPFQEAAGGALHDAAAPAPGVQRIAYPVWWHAPFYSGTGELSRHTSDSCLPVTSVITGDAAHLMTCANRLQAGDGGMATALLDTHACSS